MKRALVAWTLAFGLGVTSCAPEAAPAASTQPTQAPVAVTASTANEIQALLTKRQDALGSKDLKGFQATIDLTRPALRRCQQESFDIAARQGFQRTTVKVAKVEPYAGTYVRAYVGDDQRGYQRLYFRREGSGWLYSEPLENELGGDRSKTVGGLALTYYGIDDDIIDVYAAAGNAARTFVAKQAEGHTTTGASFGLRIFPTRGAAGPNVGCAVGGFHLPNVPSDPYIRLFSNILLLKPGLTEMSESAQSIVRHEALHWLQDQFSPGITARLGFWLTEGWPDYIGQSRTEGEKQRVVCTTPTPTFKQLEDGVLETPETPPELPTQYYAFANTMIEYLYVTFGPNAYWELMAVYKAGVDAKVNFPKVLNVTPEQFHSGWIAWAKKKLC